MHRVTLIAGDGIGPEVTAAARAVLEASGAALEFETAIVGQQAEQSTGGADAALPELSALGIAAAPADCFGNAWRCARRLANIDRAQRTCRRLTPSADCGLIERLS